jgi:hypothetical protein
MGEFVYSNVDREIEVYGYDSVTKSHCRMCHGGLEPDNLGSYDYKWIYIKGWHTNHRQARRCPS